MSYPDAIIIQTATTKPKRSPSRRAILKMLRAEVLELKNTVADAAVIYLETMRSESALQGLHDAVRIYNAAVERLDRAEG